MNVKVFIGVNGFAREGGETIGKLEAKVNEFLDSLPPTRKTPIQILQTQSGRLDNHVTITIWY